MTRLGLPRQLTRKSKRPHERTRLAKNRAERHFFFQEKTQTRVLLGFYKDWEIFHSLTYKPRLKAHQSTFWPFFLRQPNCLLFKSPNLSFPLAIDFPLCVNPNPLCLFQTRLVELRRKLKIANGAEAATEFGSQQRNQKTTPCRILRCRRVFIFINAVFLFIMLLRLIRIYLHRVFVDAGVEAKDCIRIYLGTIKSVQYSFHASW